jgi:Zyg-11 family protein
VAGEDCEKNLYTSLEAYVNERPLFVLDALNHLFEAYRDELVEEKLLGGHLIMNTMEKNLDNSRIQISGSASLFYVLKYWKEENAQLPPFYLKRLIQTVINGMEEHIDEPAVCIS